MSGSLTSSELEVFSDHSTIQGIYFNSFQNMMLQIMTTIILTLFSKKLEESEKMIDQMDKCLDSKDRVRKQRCLTMFHVSTLWKEPSSLQDEREMPDGDNYVDGSRER